MPSDILIIPNRSSTSAAPVIQFSGSQANTIRLEVLTSGSIAFLGKSGSLFSISDNLSGSLMAVSDISGLPILEVFSDDKVVMGKYNTNALVVTGSNVSIGKSVPNAKVDITGSAIITGSLTVFSGSMTVIDNTGLRVIRHANTDQTLTLTGGDGGGIASVRAAYQLNLDSSNATYPMTFQIGGSEKARITSGGDFAINKSTANAKLDVNGNTIITGSLTVGSAGAGIVYDTKAASDGRIEFKYNGTREALIGVDLNKFLIAGDSGTDVVLYSGANTNQLVVSSSGNVGIGTGTPSYKLQVNGIIFASGSGFSNPASDTGYRIKFYDNGGIYNDTGIGLEGSAGAEVMWFNALSGFYFNVGTGGEKVRIDSNGNVAINKTTANAKLDINGNTIITGSLTVTDGVAAPADYKNNLHPFLFITFL